MVKSTILKFLKLDGFVDNLTSYLETRVELLKTEVREDMVKAVAKLCLAFVLTLAFIIFILFASIALALWIGTSMGLVLGFTIVSGAYFLLAFLLLVFKKTINKSLEKKLLEIVKKK